MFEREQLRQMREEIQLIRKEMRLQWMEIKLLRGELRQAKMMIAEMYAEEIRDKYKTDEDNLTIKIE